jgi:hypothetical protein
MSRRRLGSELEALQAQALALDKKIKETAARERAKREAEEERRRQIAGAAALDVMASADPEDLATAAIRRSRI